MRVYIKPNQRLSHATGVGTLWLSGNLRALLLCFTKILYKYSREPDHGAKYTLYRGLLSAQDVPRPRFSEPLDDLIGHLASSFCKLLPQNREGKVRDMSCLTQTEYRAIGWPVPTFYRAAFIYILRRWSIPPLYLQTLLDLHSIQSRR